MPQVFEGVEVMEVLPIEAGKAATWHTYYHGRNPRMGYFSKVRVLEVRKHTARIECRRSDGTVKRRFVKLDRLWARS